MIVKLRLLRHIEELQKLLQQDDWKLERIEKDSFFARHPEVLSERSARIRLDYLGLLTSSALVIEFMFGGKKEKRKKGAAVASADA